MTSQIFPGANQQFHTTPLFWEAKKVPQKCCLQADFPTGNLKLFTALAGLKPQTGEAENLGNFFRLHLATPKSGISPRAEAFFFFKLPAIGNTVLKSLLHEKLVFFLGRR